MAIVTKDGQVIPTGNTVDTTGQSLGGGFYLPDTKENIYGAFGNITLDEDENKGVEPIVYNVYQQQAQTYNRPDMLQYTYGTGQNPVFEWVKTIQTGQRSYNPQNDFDRNMFDEFQRMSQQGQVPDGFMTPEEIMKQVTIDVGSNVAAEVGGQVGAAMVDPYLKDMSVIQKGIEGVKSTFGKTPYQYAQNLQDSLSKSQVAKLGENFTIVPSISTDSMAEATNNTALLNTLEKNNSLLNLNAGTKKAPLYAVKNTEVDKIISAQDTGAPSEFLNVGDAPPPSVGDYSSPNVRKEDFITKETIATQAGETGGYFSGVKDSLNWNTDAGASNWASSAGAAGMSFITSLALGEKPLRAAKRAGGMMIGRAIGTAVLTPVLGPLAPIVGGTIGSILGGRVICNELCRQKIMDRKQVYLDYKFTKEYLTPTHVVGYHSWAVWMVKQMRKGKFVKFWSHVAGHRANEIAYIYGERDKPDYLGKLYRKILEPTCWFIGKFNKPTNWSILYQKKEIV
jgi:hypothetical protein